jgi:hypothetical protein
MDCEASRPAFESELSDKSAFRSAFEKIDSRMLVGLLALIGAVVVISLLIKLRIMLIPFMFLEQNLLSKCRDVSALVTGGTDGISS